MSHLISLASLGLLPENPSESELFSALVDAITNKNYWLVAGLAVWLLVAALKKFGPKAPFGLGEKLGALLENKFVLPFLALLLSLAGGLVSLVQAGQQPSWKWFFSVIAAAATAVFTQELKASALAAAKAKAAELKTPEDADSFLKGGK